MKQLLCPVLFTCLIFGSARAQTPAARHTSSLAELSADVEAVAKAASPAVVQIVVRSRAPLDDNQSHVGFVANQQATGSGVILDAEGWIITNAHVVAGAQTTDVSVLDAGQANGDGHKHYAAKVVGVDRETDLALLKIEAKGLPTLEFVNSDQLHQGQLVIAIGSPLGLDNSLTVGFVSAPIRHLRDDQPMFYVQTDAAINPGNSGGPLLDTSGHIVGLNTMIDTQSGGSEGIGFAIPGNVVLKVYKELRKDGRVRRGGIGVVPQDLTPTLADALGLEHHSGVILSDIAPHGAADAAGLQPGDIVVAIDGKPMRSVRQFTAAIFEHSSGDEVTLDIHRGDKQLQQKVAVLEAPNAPAGIADLANRNPRLVRRLGILALTLDEHVTDVLSGLRKLSGVVVAAIPAEFIGLNPGLVTGDAIYEFNGLRLTSVDDLVAALGQKKAGDAIALQVERDGRLIYVAFQLE